MNIFVVNSNPYIAATELPDKLVCKMIVESCQMIAHGFWNFWKQTIPKKDGNSYSVKGYKNHPCTIWVKSNFENLWWLLRHAKSLCLEYTRRYEKIHASEQTIDFCLEFIKDRINTDELKNPEKFPRAFSGGKYTIYPTIEAYQRYVSQKYYVSWKRKQYQVPNWYCEFAPLK